MTGMKPLAGAIGLAGAGIAAPAISQQLAADAGDLEEVMVTGLRRSLEGSIDIRRNSSQFVEAVTVETPAVADFLDDYGQWGAIETWQAIDSLAFSAEAINIPGEEQTSYLEFSDKPMTYSMSEPRVALGGQLPIVNCGASLDGRATSRQFFST